MKDVWSTFWPVRSVKCGRLGRILTSSPLDGTVIYKIDFRKHDQGATCMEQHLFNHLYTSSHYGMQSPPKWGREGKIFWRKSIREGRKMLILERGGFCYCRVNFSRVGPENFWEKRKKYIILVQKQLCYVLKGFNMH